MVNLIAIGKGLVQGVKTTFKHPIESFKTGLDIVVPQSARPEIAKQLKYSFIAPAIGGTVSAGKSALSTIGGGIKKGYNVLTTNRFGGGVKTGLKSIGLAGAGILSGLSGYMGAKAYGKGESAGNIFKAMVPTPRNVAGAIAGGLNPAWAIVGSLTGKTEKEGTNIISYLKKQAGIGKDNLIDFKNQGMSTLDNYTLPAGFKITDLIPYPNSQPSFDVGAPNISLSAPPSSISMGAPIIGMPSISMGGGGNPMMDMAMLALLMGGSGYLLGRRKRKKKKYKRKKKR